MTTKQQVLIFIIGLTNIWLFLILINGNLASIAGSLFEIRGKVGRQL